MLVNEKFHCVTCPFNAASNVAFESSEAWLLSEPANNTKIPLIAVLPGFSDDLVPLLKSSYILAELIILAPLLDDLQSI